MLKIESADIYKAILENLQIGVCLVDREQRIVFWNDGAERITGFLKQEVLGRRHSESVFVPKDEPVTVGAMDPKHPIAQVLREGKRMVTDAAIHHKLGHQVPVRISTAPIRDEQGLIVAAVESFDESFASSDRNRRESVLEKHGLLDLETGVAGSAFIESQLREHVAMFENYPIPFSILSIQIDALEHWKTKLGAGAIPVIMRDAALTMENCIRPSDWLGRWRDGRFLCILTECPGSHIVSVAGRLRSSVLQDEIRWWGQKFVVTISLGGATARQGDTITSLLQRAEESLRESIKSGGDRFTMLG